MRALVPGDTVVVSKLDQLARSTRDLHNILHELQEGLRLSLFRSLYIDIDEAAREPEIEFLRKTIYLRDAERKSNVYGISQAPVARCISPAR
jgi:hypothetical protein